MFPFCDRCTGEYAACLQSSGLVCVSAMYNAMPCVLDSQQHDACAPVTVRLPNFIPGASWSPAASAPGTLVHAKTRAFPCCGSASCGQYIWMGVQAIV